MITRKHIHLALDLGCNIALPWLAYKLAEPVWGEFGGLLASALPPLLWSIVELVRHKRLDALSMMILAGIALSIFALLLGGSPKLLLVRESLISGLIGIAFIVSAPFSKPLVYHLAHAMAQRQEAAGEDSGSAAFDEWWQEPESQRMLRGITWGWGLGLTAEALLRGWLAWHWTSERFLALSPFVSYGLIGMLLLWTLWYRKRFEEPENESAPEA
ncbi:VC0807 family protein [Uliginosibacterium sp. H3]|uniref:VC0807 family protein n=1 Tax=Uliginosibacterium silvisoli TaxID=3114758 RepID=A0ABU6K8U3_9RHOO|nr:VC0807 family protein [Uliginosibacterium sp. H3]